MNNKTTFHRKRKERNFTIIDNDFIKRKDLSWKAKGILLYIFSLPDDWNINLNEIMQHATDGETSFRSGWKELTDAGYVERKPVRDEETKQITHWATYIYENVDIKGDEPHVENPNVGNQKGDNGKLLSTKGTKDLSNKDIVSDTASEAEKMKTEGPKPEEPKEPSEPVEQIPYTKIANYLNEKAEKPRGYSPTGAVFKRNVKARWNEGRRWDDFKRVIDVKVEEWKDDPSMNQYLRPRTLFGTKFDDYLNQPFKANSTQRRQSGTQHRARLDLDKLQKLADN